MPLLLDGSNPPSPTRPSTTPKKLVLCFDGTGNTFSGNTGDTNIIKLYDKLDRDAEDQFHYYQTGIGTYDITSGSVNKGFLGSFRSKVSRGIDAGFGTTFDAHVIAGYRFIMRYYDRGDKIYMFGFSRGAYTARFLARMINTVGLLSKGNEEMVPFAYQLYQRYEQGKVEDSAPSTPAADAITTEDQAMLKKNDEAYADSDANIDIQQQRRNELRAFTSTFCRREQPEPSKQNTERNPKKCYTGVKVYFLGIFDCVNSVAVLENPSPPPISVAGTAQHVRHAVAVDERRVKFKAALLDQDAHANSDEDRKEVWFPGNHGDVGGGWSARKPVPVTLKEKILDFFGFEIKEKSSKDPRCDPYQMSDIPLAWMISELEKLGNEPKQAPYALKWSCRKDGFLRNLHQKAKLTQALQGKQHDTLKFKGGSNIFKVMMWNLMGKLGLRSQPLITRR